MRLRETTKDQSFCDVGQHWRCSGYTEDESDPESCVCDCHDEEISTDVIRRVTNVGVWGQDRSMDR